MKVKYLVLLFFLFINSTICISQQKNKLKYEKKISNLKNVINVTEDGIKKASKYYSLGYFYKKNNQLDSAYKYISVSKELYDRFKDTIKVVEKMFSLGKLESENELFFKSDSTFVQALKLLGENKNKHSITISLYNSLGVNANLEKNYRKAIYWYKKALFFVRDSISKIRYKNNIANNFISIKKYDFAKKIYDTITKNLYYDSIPLKLKGKILDNYAYAKLLNNNTVYESDFLLGQKLKKEINDIPGVFTNYSYLNFFHRSKGNYKRAKHYANLMYDYALKNNRPNDRIFAINKIILSEPQSKVRKLSIERSKLKDSIVIAGQKLRNQIVTVIYNFDEEKNKRLKVETKLAKTKSEKLEQDFLLVEEKNQKQLWIFIGFILFFGFISYVFYKRNKTKREKIIEVYKTETRLAKKIHDELANDMYLAMNKLQKEERDDTSILYDLEKIYSLTRNISHENSPVVTGELFEDFLKQLFVDFTTDTCKVMNKGLSDVKVNDLRKEKQIVLYRLLQELLVNMTKHSQASLAVISFSLQKDTIQVQYKDNGIGTNTVTIKNGLKNMETRIKSIGGTIIFESENEKGFKSKFQFKK
ncbi:MULTISPECIES: sensor histidine kinase [unclassified Tenacibaculum]|uniref:sensor histidine kinase n=1 Tax=unclassified Tenacibaculum TaxID=2635139 RepID=UPI001F3DF7FE|nr:MULTISPECIES: hypothetical protein [unclassified Tenacibaculum]MCF2875066.1 hypothetical protein [Tenacibaculum sp. Cn5-1]MCF2935142.1 hypothetical protein [Tenacibaculum sp. Cn5-34]MCG7511416.1 hypothetical protein [Tenacibaculum sp. Cn5-46]